jgi:hypothetical protein
VEFIEGVGKREGEGLPNCCWWTRWWCGPGCGDGWADSEVPGRSSDGDGGGGSRGGGGLVSGTTLKVEEERNNDGYEGGGAGQRWQWRRSTTVTVEEWNSAVLRHGSEGLVDGGYGVDPVVAMAWRWLG